MDPLAHRVVARYLAADDNLVAEPGTTYVYQVDKNNQVLYPGEKVLVTVGEKLLRGEVVLGNKMVTTESGAQLPSLAVRAEDGNTYDATSPSVMKLPQTIPTQRTVEGQEMKMYDYDRRASTFEFTLRMSNDGKVHFTPISKLFVDGQQLGLISSIELRASAESNLPKLRVGVLEGLNQEGFERASPQVKKAAREVVAQLRRFPLIELVTPGYLR